MDNGTILAIIVFTPWLGIVGIGVWIWRKRSTFHLNRWAKRA